jgi:hypothetical protein
VSSDLERLLGDARDALPVPDERATEQARRRSLATLRGRRNRTRVLALVGAMLVSALALGVTAGSLNAPSGTAAREPAVLGFVPEPGWFALQSPPPAVPGQQTVAVAANVPFAADDVDKGLVEPSGLPYATLLSLPADGIVIVSTMTPEIEPHLAPIPTNPIYPAAELPFRLRDGVPLLQWGARVRPDQALAQYQLRGHIRGYDVDVVAYFGTSRPSTAQLRAAQRQLNGFVVRSDGADAESQPAAADAPAAAPAVIDRTYSCKTVLLGGIYELKSRAHSGVRSGSGWAKLPYAVAASGGWAGPLTGLPNAPPNSLAWITAGTPSKSTSVGNEAEVFPVLGGGTIGVNESLCRPSQATVELGNAGLRGGTVPRESVGFDCAAPRELLVRFRATVRGTEALRERARLFLATNAPAREAKLAVRTPAGKLLAYADVSESGRTRLFTATACSPE